LWRTSARPEDEDVPESTTSSRGFGFGKWRGLRLLAGGVTLAGIAAVVAAEVRLSGGEFSLGALPLFAWPLIPFGVALFGVSDPHVTTARSIGIAGASGFGLASYADLVVASRLSSTAGLAFLFIPLWQLIGCAVVMAFTIRRTNRDGAA
jgi:hypothetical protein